MAIRLVVTLTAAPGKGAELAQAYRARCEEVMKEPGCEQFEVFQTPLLPELRVGSGEREDYEYNRTR